MIFSRNKYIDYSILVMLYLMSMNFFHLGQLFLPLTCLLIFIDNKFDFSFLKDKYFLLLIAFAISFFAFSYTLGFYSVMGCCLPMAYYIGTHVKNRSFDSFKKIVYVLALGMATHVILNFAYNVVLFGDYVFMCNPRDIWLREKITPTAIASLYCFIIGIFYYSISYEKTKIFKNTIIVVFVVMFIYEISLGRRTPMFMLIINVGLCVFFEIVSKKTSFKLNKYMKLFIVVFFIVIVTMFAVYTTDFLGLKKTLFNIGIFRKFAEYGLDLERIDILLNSLKYAPQFPFGGQMISGQLGIQVHDLWSDVYDYAGVIPFVIIVALTVIVLIKLIKYIFDKKIEYTNRLFVFSLSICIFMQMALEPAMTGCSILVICSTIVFSMFSFL